jgi:glycerol-3-phosphate dehydrogenase (NAD(P)+)
MKAAVIGSGAWGTALAIRLLENGHDVTMWTFEVDLIPKMERERINPRLQGVLLPEGLKISPDYS